MYTEHGSNVFSRTISVCTVIGEFCCLLNMHDVCRYYLYLYSHWLPRPLRDLVSQLDGCDDILINFLVSHVTQRPPIRVARRPGRHSNRELLLSASEASMYHTRQYCVRTFAEQFGYMPLIRSSVRFEPLLYRDPVSVFRKKYRRMEIGVL